MDITNKTKKPLSVPLPGGKKLFLQPGKTGQVTAKALEHPPVVKLIEAGELETAESARERMAPGGGGKTGPSGGSTQKGGAGGAARQSGDR